MILYDESGKIQGIETQTDHINQMQSRLMTAVNSALADCSDTTFTVSLGTVTGVWIFSGHGPAVSLRLQPMGSASVQLVSRLESAGINQTCHAIYAEVSVRMSAAIPFYQAETEVTYEYLLAETLLMGDVPETYTIIEK